MTLHIQDPRVERLAQELAQLRNVSLDHAILGALESELKREQNPTLAERIRPTIDDLHRRAKPGGRDLTKGEIDAMWGHE